ncbi:class I SAM-dependent methyltransferase [Candidatus Parcubacteria bacterium]|nr:class I SAM-dependent methyltransferase [Candidatus Parcubacteria bacterium]
MEQGYQITKCRMCQSSNLYRFLDLGSAPLSDAILSEEDLKSPEPFFPLNVLQCQDCGLTQLGYVVDPALMYGPKYKYESSITITGKEHFFSMAAAICKEFDIQKDSFCIDIGSNVGVLLEGFKNQGMKVLGIDPSPEICKIANARGIETWQDFFGPSVAPKVLEAKGRACVITGTNVFAHIDDKEGLVTALKMLLDDKGMFIFEVPYLVDLIETLAYDTIYLEHLEYISLKPVVLFFKKHGMEVFDVQRQDIHAKSIRVFVCQPGQRQVSSRVRELLDLEETSGIYTKEVLDLFATRVKKHKEDLLALLQDLKSKGKKVIGISAPAKGNTILNYCKIGSDMLDYITEKSTIKIGHYTPGMHIPIVKEGGDQNQQADYGIIFAWNFAPEIIKNNEAFAKQGGKFIIPIPKPAII